MTAKQKAIGRWLLDGCYVVASGPLWFRLRTRNHMVVSKFGRKTWGQFKEVMRVTKGGVYVLDKRRVRSLHGNSWLKQLYREDLKIKNEKNHDQHRCTETRPQEVGPGDQQQAGPSDNVLLLF